MAGVGRAKVRALQALGASRASRAKRLNDVLGPVGRVGLSLPCDYASVRRRWVVVWLVNGIADRGVRETARLVGLSPASVLKILNGMRALSVEKHGELVGRLFLAVDEKRPGVVWALVSDLYSAAAVVPGWKRRGTRRPANPAESAAGNA